MPPSPISIKQTEKGLNVEVADSRVFLPRPRSPFKFIISPGLWKIPNFNNLPALLARVKTNLLYFQTNYLILNFIIFACIMITCMKTLVAGIISVIVIGFAVLFFLDHIPQARQIKQNYPTVVIVGGIALVVVIWNALHTILIVLIALLSPVPLWLLHASLRSTDGLTDGNEDLGHTPVGHLMQIFGINLEDGLSKTNRSSE